MGWREEETLLAPQAGNGRKDPIWPFLSII
jgi:hypothetical protein